MSKRAHIVIPGQLAEEIDALVGKRARSSFLTDAAWKEVRRLRMLNALEEAAGPGETRITLNSRAALQGT
jgi:hypothetical protein